MTRTFAVEALTEPANQPGRASVPSHSSGIVPSWRRPRPAGGDRSRRVGVPPPRFTAFSEHSLRDLLWEKHHSAASSV